MKSQWETWLRQCAAAGQGGVVLDDVPIVRGLPYTLTLPFPADFSADDFKASLRLSPDAGGATQADFAVTIGAYSGGFTEVLLALTKVQTAALASDADADGVEELLFDLLHTPDGGTQYRLMALSIPLTGALTSAD